MTSPKLLLPLRIPELGPFLGKIVVGTRREMSGPSFDAVRTRLVTRIFEHAGEARRLAGREERASAVAAVGRTAWLEAWEEAATGVATELIAYMQARLGAEAAAVGMSGRARARARIEPAEQRALGARLASAGALLVHMLDALEQRGVATLDATTTERDAVQAWQEALKASARQLEAAWLALEEAADAELRRWNAVADEIAGWRKPLWPVVVTGVAAVILASWLGLVFGGYVDSPAWLSRAWQVIVGSLRRILLLGQ